MGSIINLNKYRKQKQEESEIIKEIRDSLDNDKVKKNYKITTPPPPPQPTIEERMENIRKSIKEINKLVAQLKDKPEGESK